MAIKILRLSELRGLTKAQILDRVAEFNSGYDDPPDADIEELNRRIAIFEMRYEMSSRTMQRRLRLRTQKATAEITEWAVLVAIRKKLLQSQ